jgi:hypothetical protein
MALHVYAAEGAKQAPSRTDRYGTYSGHGVVAEKLK